MTDNSGNDADEELPSDQTSAFLTVLKADVMRLMKQFKNLSTPIVIIASKTFVLYVIGTNHAVAQCQEDVATVIKVVRPKNVLLELCASRVCGCSVHRSSVFQTKPEFNYKYLKKAIDEIGTVPGMIFFADVYKERRMAEEIYMNYGGEMARALLEGKAVGSEIILGDRPIEVTMQRQSNALNYWKKILLIAQVGLAMKMKNWKAWCLLKASKIVFRDEKAFRVLVHERDLYLTFAMQTAVTKTYPDTKRPSTVAVVGRGHLQGIRNSWGKVTPHVVRNVSATEGP